MSIFEPRFLVLPLIALAVIMALPRTDATGGETRAVVQNARELLVTSPRCAGPEGCALAGDLNNPIVVR